MKNTHLIYPIRDYFFAETAKCGIVYSVGVSVLCGALVYMYACVFYCVSVAENKSA